VRADCDADIARGVPAIYANRNFPETAGLMSYGSNWTDTFRQSGVYTAHRRAHTGDENARVGPMAFLVPLENTL
jgi:hypothetical protein